MTSSLLLACNAMLWTSFISACILSIIYYTLGRRFLLITWMAISLSGSYLLKLYLTSLRLYFDAKAFAPGPMTGIIVLINIFWAVSYNMALVLVAVHIGAIIKFGSVYDHRRYQTWMVFGGSLPGLLQVLDYWRRLEDTILMVDSLPFAWINLAVLWLGLLVTPPIIGYLIYRFARCREASLNCMKQSAISQSLCYRLLFALAAACVLTGNSILTQLISNGRQTGDRFGPFYPFHATPEQLAHRYLSATFIGMAIFVIFASSDESVALLWRFRRQCKRKIYGCLFQATSDLQSAESLSVGSSHGQLRKLSLPTTFDNLPMEEANDHLGDGEEQPGEEDWRTRIARYAQRHVEGSLASASTIHPPSSLGGGGGGVEGETLILDLSEAAQRTRRQTLPHILNSSSLRIHSSVPEEILVGSYKGSSALIRSNSATNLRHL